MLRGGKRNKFGVSHLCRVLPAKMGNAGQPYFLTL